MRRGLAAGAPVLVALIALAGCGGGGAGAGGTSPAAAATALRARLAARDLSPRWVRCADSGRRAGGDPVYRCTVNYGDPHILAYCAVLRGGRLATQVEDPALRCGRVRGGPGAGARP